MPYSGSLPVEAPPLVPVSLRQSWSPVESARDRDPAGAAAAIVSPNRRDHRRRSAEPFTHVASECRPIGAALAKKLHELAFEMRVTISAFPRRSALGVRDPRRREQQRSPGNGPIRISLRRTSRTWLARTRHATRAARRSRLIREVGRELARTAACSTTRACGYLRRRLDKVGNPRRTELTCQREADDRPAYRRPSRPVPAAPTTHYHCGAERRRCRRRANRWHADALPAVWDACRVPLERSGDVTSTRRSVRSSLLA